MTVPRRELICPEETLYYHCISRCVRRAYLHGLDPLTGKDHSHRKTWIIERLKLLGEVFCIDLCAYAVMSNHYHLVLRLAPERVEALSNEEVITRWCRLYRGNALVERYKDGEWLSEEEYRDLDKLLVKWRDNLGNISRYMQALNEPIARRSNREDECTGRFWEGRFKSQAILDEAGLLACMAYVDLNPFRAGATEEPIESADVSIHARLQAASQRGNASNSPALLPFTQSNDGIGKAFDPREATLPCSLSAYVDTLRWLAERRAGKLTRETTQLPPDICQRLSIEPQVLLSALRKGQISRGTAIGMSSALKSFVQRQRRQRVIGARLKAA